MTNNTTATTNNNITTTVPVHHVFGINVYRNLGGFGEVLCTFNFRSAATEDGLVKAISKLLKRHDIILDKNNDIINDDGKFVYSIAVYEIESMLFGLDEHTIQIRNLKVLADTVSEIDFDEIEIDKVRRKLTSISDVLKRTEEYYAK